MKTSTPKIIRGALSALLSVSVFTFSLQSRAGCAATYQNILIERQFQITKMESEVRDLRNQLVALQNREVNIKILGILAVLFSPVLATASLALGPAATIATVVGTGAVGASVGAAGTYAATKPTSSSVYQQMQTMAQRLTDLSLQLIELKYAQYSETRVANLMKEIEKGVKGAESSEVLRRVQAFTNSSSEAQPVIQQMLATANNQNLFCIKDFEMVNVEAIEEGLVFWIEHPSSNIKNPFINAQVLKIQKALNLQIASLDKEIRDQQNAKQNLSSIEKQVEKAMSLPDQSRQQRYEKYDQMVDIADLIRQNLAVVLRASMPLQDMKKIRSEKFDYLNKLKSL